MITGRHDLSNFQNDLLVKSLTTLNKMPIASQVIIDLNEDLAPRIFWQAWDIILERHPILRSSIHWHDDSTPMMEIHDRVSLPVVERDLREVSPLQQEREIESFMLDESNREFALESAPLFRLDLFRLADTRHRFVQTSHHLILDDQSTARLHHELFTVYDSLKHGHRLELPRARPYADYIDWLSRQEWDQAQDYWKARLKGMPAPSLPRGTQDPHRVSDQAVKGYGLRRFKLPQSLSQALKQLAKETGLDLEVILQSTLGILLADYCGGQDIIYGAARAIGDFATVGDTGTMIGPMVNILPLRIEITPEQLFIDLLKMQGNQWLELGQNEHTPLYKINKWLGRNPGETLFEFVLSVSPKDWMSEIRSSDQSWLNRRVEMIPYPPYPLSLNVYEAPEMIMTLTYDRGLYEVGFIDSMLSRFELLIYSIVSRPEARISELSIEPSRLSVPAPDIWGVEPAGSLSLKCAHQIFEERVRETPDALAVIAGEERITYADLNERSNRLAHYLRELGLGPERGAGIFLERSIDVIVAILAVLKAGGTFVPFDAAYPIDRLAVMVSRSRLKIVLTHANLAERLPEGIENVVSMDRFQMLPEEKDPQTSDNLDLKFDPDQLAYVIFTSGSTGLPKGVMVPHCGLSNLTTYLGLKFEIGTGKRILQFAPFSFDASLWDIWMALGNGATLVMADSERMSNKDLLALLRTQKVNLVTLLPSVLNLLSDIISEEDDLANLDTVIAASEPCPRETVEHWGRGRKFFNAYGPTEATVCVTVGEGEVGYPWAPPIGRPVSNVQVHILDQSLRPVPLGEIGELYVSGISLSRGYLNQPELTAENFIPNPFSGNGERLYRTGDQVRFRYDGNLEFIGRCDRQIKLRGFRVELGEIEAALESHASVRQAAVSALDSPGGSQLAAYVVRKGIVREGDLRLYLKGLLPEYMLPQFIMFLDTMPLTQNGKVDHNALPIPFKTIESGAPHTSPRDELEAELCKVWESVLNVQPIGVEDRFFDLGGHSLKAIQLANRIEEKLGRHCPIMILFEEQTIAGLARYLRQAAADSSGSAHFIHREVSQAPLSPGQSGLWLISKLENHGAHYNIPAAVRLIGKLDLPALRTGFRTITQRHAILRTVFNQSLGDLYQEKLPAFEPEVQIQDISGLPSNQRETEIQRLAVEFDHVPFDLERNPAWRIKLIRIDDDDHVLLICFYHILFDEWSLDLFYEELEEIYDAVLLGRSPNLQVLTYQFSDYVFFQKEWLETKAAEDQRNYWLGILKDLNRIPDYEWDHPRPARPTYHGAFLTSEIPESLAMDLRGLTQSAGVTSFTTLLSVFAHVLARLTGRDQIRIGTPISNRQPVEFERSIGYFLNTLVLSVDLSGNPIFTDYQGKVNQTVIQAFDHRQFPYEYLLQQLQSEYKVGSQPPFRVLFNYYPEPAPSLELQGLRTTRLSFEHGWSKFDISIYITDSGHEIELRLVYNTDVIEKSTAERLLTCFKSYLENLHGYWDESIASIPIIDPAEQAEILAASRGSDVNIPGDLLIQQMFEKQVKRAPDATAVSFQDQSLSYLCLNQLANQLAHYLQQRGAGPELRIGILTPRSMDLLVAVLAVLKAGAGFVLLDPEFPPRRLAQMLEEADVSLLVTSRQLNHPLLVFPDFGLKEIIFLDQDQDQIEMESTENPPPIAAQDNLAYIFFTSGSTGHPKAVLTTHRGVVNYLHYLRDIYKFDERTVSLQITAVSFDPCVRDFFLPLLVGGKIVMVQKDDVLDPPRLFEIIQKNQITTILSIVPSMLRAILASFHSGSVPDGQMDWILVSGEQLFWEDILAARNVFGRSVGFVNQYGPTETTMTCSYYPVPVNIESRGVLSIGRPISNAALYVLDVHLNLMPSGVIGDLYIAGIGVTRGYAGRPDLTAEAFIPDPFSSEPGRRMYRTGDRARYLSDGNLEFIGRTDNQLKVRGIRIEPGEIESVIRQHPGVKDCAVVSRKEQDLDPRLFAYLVLSGNDQLSDEDLRLFLAERLPEYLIPSGYQVLDQLPLTPTGKVDRMKLPAIQVVNIASASFQTPRNPTEETVAQILSELLGGRKIGVYDNFFDLGGHSLLAMRLILHLGEKFDLDIPLRSFLQNPNVAALAVLIDSSTNLLARPKNLPAEFEEGEI